MSNKENAGFVPLDGMGGIKEPEMVQEGTYDLMISNAKKVTGPSGKDYIAVVIEIMGEPDAEVIFHNVFLPHADDSPDNAKSKKLNVARFGALFGFDTSKGVDIPGMQGCQASNVGVFQDSFERKDGTEGMNNKISIPKISAEK